MSVSLTLAQLLSGLINSFQSIDIRCAVKKYEPGWLSLLTSIRISARPLDAIQERYQELENDGLERNADPFRILWHAYPIDQIERILTELASAQLSIEGESVRLPEQVEAGKLRGQLEYAPSLVIPWDGEKWPATFYYSSGNRTLSFSDPEITAGVRRSGWRSTEAMVAHFLGLNLQQLYSTSIPLFLFVEMPAKIEVRALANTMPEILLRTQPTLSDFTLYLSTDRHKGRPFTMPIEKYSQEGIWTLHRSPLDLAKLEPDDIFSCTLSHPAVPVLDEVTGCLRNFMPIPYLNPLLLCLQQFWDMNGFSDRLERAYDKPSGKKDHNAQHVFQESVAQLLTLAGFQTIDLGREEHIEGNRSKVRRATLDILAYHAGSKTMILGACTITPPKTDDIQGVLETMSILRGKFPADAQVHFVPMIFSIKEQESMNHEDVRILNARKIRKLRTIVESGQENQFIQSLQWPFQDVLDEP
jgi:hypothetical protein